MEVATAIFAATGQEVVYTDLPAGQYAEILKGAGLPEPLNEIIADSSAAIGRGELVNNGGDLARLIGRPTTSLAATLKQAAAAL